MTLPANIRVNANLPFPSLVKGGGPVVLNKRNGVWTVSLTYVGLTAMQANADPTTKQILVYDLTTQTFQTTTIAALVAATFFTRTVTAAGDVNVLANDRVLLLNKTVPEATNILLPTAASRSNVPLTVKDLNGSAGAFPLTLVPNGIETIDGHPSAVINDIHQAMTINPISTGGWWVG